MSDFYSHESYKILSVLERRIENIERIAEKLERLFLEGTLECPSCKRIIQSDVEICQYCGGNWREITKENRMRRQQKNEQILKSLFSNQKIMDRANTMKAEFGKQQYNLYLKQQAQELGFGDLQLVDDEETPL